MHREKFTIDGALYNSKFSADFPLNMKVVLEGFCFVFRISLMWASLMVADCVEGQTDGRLEKDSRVEK